MSLNEGLQIPPLQHLSSESAAHMTSAPAGMETTQTDQAFSRKSDFVKRLHQVSERIFANVLGDISESPSFAPSESLEGVRHNADQDIRDLIDAHAHLDQFFARKRLIYTQQHPEKVLQSYIAEMKKAVARKEHLIRRHHTNLSRWTTVLKNEPPPSTSVEERPVSTPQPPDSPAKRQEIPRPAPPLSAAPQPSPAAPTFPSQPTGAAGLYGSSAPSPQPYVQPAPPPMYHRPQHRQPGAGYMNRGQIPPGGFSQGFSGQPSSLSAILQSAPSPGPLMGQTRPMRSQSPSVPSPASYGAVPSPRVPWRASAPPGAVAAPSMGYGAEDPGAAGDMGYYQQHSQGMPGSGGGSHNMPQ
ncbi:translation initiation factor IF-2-like [Paramacrobiotus metropolitanus]|uniref:translation initiation factor IF-2-like n=1 Tax=Paramacrobiotus metropolitanus TaxID=2943436 RepID=UPI002445F4A8|nr:translation initiation factor IF-2-like [Paramacrobiotus metropolitanus]